jgi:hypothetical protein
VDYSVDMDRNCSLMRTENKTTKPPKKKKVKIKEVTKTCREGRGKIIILHGKKRDFHLFALFHRIAYVFCYFVVLHPVYGT